MPALPPVTAATGCVRFMVISSSQNRSCRSSSSNKRQHPQGAAAALLDLERRADQHRAGGRQLVEVREALQAVLARAVHEVVAGIRRAQVVALAGVGADGL